MVAIALELLGAGAALCLAVTVGTLTHELSHAAALRALGVPCVVEAFPDADVGALGGTIPGRWATVRPVGAAGRLTPWRLRVAALMPLCLVVPFLLVPLGVVPDPFAMGHPVAVAAAVGWAACALPSPQDFALVWYPERAATLADRPERPSGTDAGA